MNRTRAQRRLRKQGYTYEVALLKEPFPWVVKVIVISKGHRSSWREHRRYLFEGEVIRPIAHTYIHKGGKP